MSHVLAPRLHKLLLQRRSEPRHRIKGTLSERTAFQLQCPRNPLRSGSGSRSCSADKIMVGGIHSADANANDAARRKSHSLREDKSTAMYE